MKNFRSIKNRIRWKLHEILFPRIDRAMSAGITCADEWSKRSPNKEERNVGKSIIEAIISRL